MDVYTLEAGRAIRRNGQPFVSVAGCSRESPGYAPADFDTFARFTVAAVDTLRRIERAALRPGSELHRAVVDTLALLPKPEAPAVPVCQCDNCDWRGPEAELGRSLHEIHHLAERLDPGSEVPAGECPECGALAYIIGEGKS